MMGTKLLSIILIVCVMAVFLAPAVSLEPTALRSFKSASLLLAVLTTLVTSFALLLWTDRVSWTYSETVQPASVPIQDLTCSRLC